MSSTNGSPNNAAPVNQSERIIILDSLRGLAAAPKNRGSYKKKETQSKGDNY